MSAASDVTVTLAPSGRGAGFARLTFANAGKEPRWIDRRMACLEGFVPLGSFRFRRPARFVGPRVTCFGTEERFYLRLDPGSDVAVDVDLRSYEGLSGTCDVMYEALHGDPAGRQLLELRSNPAKIPF